jgi:hypothetical protein
VIFLGEVSAKTGQNIEHAFRQISKYLLSQKFNLPLPNIAAAELAATVKPVKNSRYAALKRTLTTLRFSFNDKTTKKDYVCLPKVERTSIQDIYPEK